MFGQTFELHDLVIVGLLAVLEGVLSIDNALVLGLLARRLPTHLRKKALTYGLVGALVFRLIAIGMASLLLQWSWAKLLGGGYLVYVAGRHFVGEYQKKRRRAAKRPEEVSAGPQAMAAPSVDRIKATTSHSYLFWYTVVVIELTDIAFAIDSILAAIGLVSDSRSEVARAESIGRHPKLWVIATGGMLGVIVMRFAAMIFIRLLERFPRFDMAAYLLVLVIGTKLVLDWGFNTPEHPHRLDFHNAHHVEFWIFWVIMASAFCVGFIRRRRRGGRL